RIVAGLLLNRGERGVHDLLGGAALAVAHQRADELRHERAAVERIERHFAFGDLSSSWHMSASSYQLPASSSCLPALAGSWRLGAMTLVSSLRTSIAPACVPAHRRRRACRERRGSEHPADPSRGRRE